jgi:2-keto-4-pentenoate hydratase/2-oxohepta-3-ene-1,7-dioic acid hydratase in catechol pathway
MKLATLEMQGRLRVVALSDDARSYLEIEGGEGGFDGDMIELIQEYPDPRVIRAHGSPSPIDGHRLCAPIASPRRNLFCVGKNYREHAKEFNQSGFDAASAPSEIAPPAPSFFTKPGSSIVGPNEPVLSHAGATKEIDYEVELAVVIGKPGRGIRKKDAYSHVWGYTIVNDVTARDLQKAARQWFLGKSLDTFCPMGPCIATADEIDPENVDVRTWINGELRQDANTRDLIFDIPTLIETLSAGMTLQPGDVIATGTPAGVGIGFCPPRFLRPGDEMRLAISGIGELVNRIQ